MEYSSGYIDQAQEISRLFTATFAAAEGADEGRIIGKFVRNLMETTAPEDLFAFSANSDRELVGCIFLSRLTYEQDHRKVFILSPVAVKTDWQKKGVGQRLITHGLNQLRQNGIDIVLTYGDPNYYSKVGFQQITEQFAQAPLKLSQPIGWLGQSLSGKDQKPLAGPSRCVRALNDPTLW